ncbi:MAG: immunoglobulin-like domain-containing protein [Clostridiaceae bacterium]|nr:hypothetical protein [Eubacteriales bacterium]
MIRKCTALLLFACVLFAAQTALAATVNGVELQPSPYGAKLADKCFALETEYPVYAKDIEKIYFTITNKTKKSATFGDEYSLEIYQDGGWYVWPLKTSEIGPNGETVVYVWPGDEYDLDRGSTRSGRLPLSSFKLPLVDGVYRVVKLINGKPCAAQFEVGASRITAATPHGFARTEELPAAYSFDDALAEGAYVIRGGEQFNRAKVADFIRKSGMGIPCTLRVVEEAENGTPLVKDILFGQLIQWRCYAVRTRGADGKVETEYYSNLSVGKVNKKNRVVLCDYINFGKYAPKDARFALISGAVADASAEISAVQKLVKTRTSIYVYTCLSYSPDAKYYATVVRSGKNRVEVSLNSANTYASKTIYAPASAGTPKGLTSLRWLDGERFELRGVSQSGKAFTAVYNVTTGAYES